MRKHVEPKIWMFTVWLGHLQFSLLQTFRPKKKFEVGTMKYSLHKQAQASLNSGINLKFVVKLPGAEDLNDWIAVHGEEHSAKAISSLASAHATKNKKKNL